MRNLILKCLNFLKLVIVLSVFAFISYGCGGGGGGNEGVAPATGGGPTQIPTWYKDADGDGYSDGTTQKSETRPSNIYHKASELTSTSGDCNDNDSSIHPGASEVCSDSKDNDCDGKTDEDCCIISYYVSPVGDDGYSCLSPGTPCKTIQHAIDVAYGTESCPVTIHVAAGTYKEHLVMDSWESLEGGWYGNFTQQWDFENDGLEPDPAYATIIDGEAKGTCLKLENIEGVTVDGFIVQKGKGDLDEQDPEYYLGYGGGAYCHNSSVNFKHTTFLENTAEVGIVLYNLSSSVVISKCVFRSNYYFDPDLYGIKEGGVIYHVGGTLRISNSDFIENSAYYSSSGIINQSDWSEFVGCRFIGNGGTEVKPTLYNIGTSALIINCIFEDNYNYGGYGGALANHYSEVQIINCIFAKNYQGAITNNSSSPEIINCTFFDNQCLAESCAIYNSNDSSPTITNSIFWYDNHIEAASFILPSYSSTATVTFSNINQPGYESQNGNINQDPMFFDTGWDDNGTPDDPSDDVWVGDYDFRLQDGSPCINSGDNTALPPDTADLDNDGDMTETIPLDLNGNPRIIDGVVNMGAYE